MNDSINDTIDLREESEEFDEVDEILASGSMTVAAETRHTGFIELALVVVANVIWAVVGLVLWLPKLIRAVLWTAIRTIHSALTDQSSGRAVAGIKEVSRSYVERFVHRQSEQARVGRRHELRPFRLVAEVGWALGFYLLLLRWLAPERFGPVWGRVVEWTGAARDAGSAAMTELKGWLVPDPGTFDEIGLKATGLVLLAVFVGLVLGFWLGRRGR